MAGDPIARFRSWLRAARRAGVAHPEAMTLATATPGGRPSLRWVLLKHAGPAGFVLFTDAGSRKGRELARNPRAALAFYWEPLGRQVRVEGRVEPLPAAEVEAYWHGRPRASRLSAAISRQSAPVASWRELVARRRALARALAGGDSVPRPRRWRGFRVRPERIEFWRDDSARLHRRELYVRRRGRGAWRRTLLQP